MRKIVYNGLKSRILAPKYPIILTKETTFTSKITESYLKNTLEYGLEKSKCIAKYTIKYTKKVKFAPLRSVFSHFCLSKSRNIKYEKTFKTSQKYCIISTKIS